jgi:Tfp pilus assembly protein PilE
MSSITKQKTLSLIAIIGVLLGIIAFLGYYAYDLKQQVTKDVAALENKQQQLEKVYAKLDSISKSLDDKIQEIQKLGGKVEGLIKVKKQLEREKYELKLSKKIAADRYVKIKEKILAYEILLKEKDEEILKLRQVNELLSAENQGLKQHADSLKGKLTDVSGTAESLSQKIKSAAGLKASAMVIQAVAENGKIRTEAEYKSKHIQVLRLNFKIDDNKIAEQGNKKIILKIIDATGNTLTAADGSSATFTYTDKEMAYSTAKEVLFDNSGQSYFLDFKNVTPYQSGRYMVEIYNEGLMIGSTSFVIK